jgi:hypothetical protein
MVLGRSILETLAGEYLPTHITLRSEQGGDAPCQKVAAFLREWAAALDGAAAGTSVPITGTIGDTKGEHDDR